MKKYSFLRKALAGSLSFFLLSSNLSFLGVVLEPIVGTMYADFSVPCTAWSVLGEQCGGGIVYANSGGIVSIAAPEDEVGLLAWGSSGTTAATDLFNGFTNTETLSGTFGSAAESCWNKVGSGGTTDWYLPSKFELMDMNTASGVIGIFSSGSRYWSSTEFDTTDAYDVWFGGANDGIVENTNKGGNYPVRCMRKVDLSGSWVTTGTGTTGYIPGTSYQSPVTTVFSNSGQVAGTGSVQVSITNDRFMTMSGITVLSIGLSDKFVLSNPSITSFSGVLSTNSCSGALLIKKDAYAPVNMLECKLTTPLASFSSGEILSVTIDGVTNPAIPGKYEIGAKMKTANWDEFFYGETFIKDNFDSTPPVLTGVFPIGQYQLLLEFNEPIYTNYMNNSITGSFSPSLSFYSSYVDYNNPRKLFLSTSEQLSATSYVFNVTGIKDFNGNIATASGSYTSYDPLAKDLDYISPYTLSQGKSYTGVSLYGKNNIFSGVSAWQITIGSLSGITFSNVGVDEANRIHFQADVSTGATLGNRDISVTVAGVNYRLFNAFWVDKNWDNYAFWQNVSPLQYNSWATTGMLRVEFSDVISSIGTLSVDKNYGTTNLTPSITTESMSGNILELSLAGVESGVGYDLSFSGITFNGGKILNEYNNRVFFSFFDGNYNTQILPPIVNYSFPSDFSSDVPVRDMTASGFVMKVGFDQELDYTTVTSTNIKLKDESDNEVISTFSYSGTELTVSTSSPLSYGKKYSLSLSSSVKSTKGLNLVGNIPASEGGGHKIAFNTVNDYANMAPSTATNGFFIEKTDPFYEAQNVPRDAKMRVIFNEVIDKTTVQAGTVRLYDISNTTPVQKTVSFTYDNEYTPKTLYVSGGLLNPSTRYRLAITGSGSGVKSMKNQSLMTALDGYMVEFTTGTGMSADIPLSIMWDYRSPDNTAFEVGFSSPLDASTINASSVALYQSGGTKITTSVGYNHFANSLKLEPSVALLSDTDYKIVLKAGNIKDIGGNSIATGTLSNGFTYNSTNGTIEKSYSTAGSIVTPFFIESFWATSTNMEVKFSKPIADALNKSNYILNYCTAPIGSFCTPSTSVSLADAVIAYDDIERRVMINGLSIPSSTSSTQTVVEINLANVKDKFSNTLTTTTQQTVLFSANVGTSFQATTQAIELKANLSPQNNTSGKKSLYFIDFPLSSRLSAGSKVEVSFPAQFDLSLAKFDSGSYANYVNGDKTKPKFGIVKLADKNILEYTISADYAAILRENDYIVSDIQDIINPLQAKDYTTDGYTAEITAKNSSGIVVSKIQSNPIFIKEAPTGSVLKTLTIQVKDKNGVNITGASISGAVIGLNTPSGYEELLADANGTIVYTGEVGKTYSLFLNPEIKLKNPTTNIYTASNYIPTDAQFLSIYLDTDKTIDILLKDKTDAAEFVTLSGSITGLSGKELTVWVSSPNGFFNKDLGVIGSPATFELQVPKNAGYTTVGIGPTMSQNVTTAYKVPDFMPPKPLSVNVGTENISGMDFVVELPTIDFTVIVKDNSASGKTIPKANVYAYTPSGDSMGLYGQTDAMGQVKFKTKAGVYTYGAYIEGLPTPAEQTITIGTSGIYTGTLIVTMPNRTIAGKLLNGNNPISGVNLSAYNESKGTYLNTMTDSAGDYKFYVEDGTWKIGGWVQTYGPLTEKTLLVAGESLSNQNFVISQEGVYSMTGSVNLASASGTGISGVNIFAESSDNDYTKNYFAFTDSVGGFNLSLKNGTYTLHAYHPQYGEVGTKTVTVAGANGSVGAFVIEPQKTVTISMTGAGLPTNLSQFEWIVDVFDTVNKKGFNKKIKSLTGYTFENVGAGTYDIKINVTGMGQVFGSGSFVVDANKNIEIALQETEQLVSIGGTVYLTGTATPLQDAFVEVRNTLTKQSVGVKTNTLGGFDLKFKKGANYELMVKKPGYEKSVVFTGTLANTGVTLANISLKPVSTTINVAGTVAGSGSLHAKTAFVSLQGTNENGADTSKWFGQQVTISGSTFTLSGVPANFGSGKLIFATEGYEMKTDAIRNYASANISTISLSLASLQISTPKSLPITPSQGGVISDTHAGMKLTLPSNALGTSTNPGTIITKETSLLPNTPGGEPVGGKAKEIAATDSNGQPITNLQSDVTLELTYSGSEFTATHSGITLDEVKNMQISYYDSTAESWISLPTIVTCSSGTLFENYTGSTLLSTLSPGTLVFTLKTKTDHFTLFTALVSTVIANASVASSTTTTTSNPPSGGGGGGSSASLTTGLAVTFNSISKYLGDTTQSIVLKSGSNIGDVLSIKREGKTIALADLLKSGAGTFSSVGKNLVSFAVGDIITTSKQGSLEIALDGYSKMQIAPGSSMKIAEAGNGFLSYENIGGKVQYQFDKRDDGKFEYKVKGKTGYATIRGTTLEVSSDSTKDVYKLIEGKIDIYNSFLKKTVSLVSGDSYTAYANGTEDMSNVAALKGVTPAQAQSGTMTVTSTKITACGSYTDVDSKSEWCPYLIKLNGKGIIRTNATYEPNRSISRAELLKMANLSKGTPSSFSSLHTYGDIKSTDWWAPYVSTAKKLGYISATNINFEPNRPITRAEAMKIIMNFSGTKMSFDSKYTYSDIKSTDWWAQYVSTAKKLGYISATQTKFRPNDPISRAEVAKILSNIFFK